MRTRTLLQLALVTAVVVIAAAATVWQQRRAAQPSQPQPMIESIQGQGVNDVVGLVITRGEQRVAIQRRDDAWTLASSDGYPADIAAVRAALLQLQSLRLLEEKAANEALLGPLGLGPGAASEPTSVTVEIAGAATVRIEVGSVSPDGLGRYVRLLGEGPGSGEVWITDGRLDLDPTVPAWAPSELLRLGSDFLASITIYDDEGRATTLTRDGSGPDARYTLEPMPEGRELGSPSQLAMLFGSVAMLAFIDVRSLESDAPVEADRVTFETTTGSRFDIHAWNEADVAGERSHWISIEYEGDQKRALEGWAYRVPPVTAEAFDMGIDELTFEASPDPQPADADPDPLLPGPPGPR